MTSGTCLAVIDRCMKVWRGLVFVLLASFISLPAVAQPNADKHPFDPIAEVLLSPRCVNCHPRDDIPKQRDDGRRHAMSVARGPDNLGNIGARCYACHQPKNSTVSNVPGAPNWHLAPLSMGWKGLSHVELCTVLKDPTLNGGKDVAALVKHMEEDPLVLWGWDPGNGRKPVGIPHNEFVKLLKYWADQGAPCPAS